MRNLITSAVCWIGLLVPSVAAAADGPTRRFGGCTDDGFFCAGPSVSVSLVGWDIDAQRWRLGVVPGVGYGVTFFAKDWYQLGLAAYATVLQRNNLPTVVTPAAIVSFAEYVRLGIASDITESTATAPASSSPIILFGFGIEFGRTTTSSSTENNVFGSPPPTPPQATPPGPEPVPDLPAPSVPPSAVPNPPTSGPTPPVGGPGTPAGSPQ